LADSYKYLLKVSLACDPRVGIWARQFLGAWSIASYPFDILSRAYVLDLQDACTKIYKAYTDPMPGTDFQPAQSEKINAATLW
jgi:hypothetical protein